MNKDAVQHERGPRNSTIRRQVAMYLRETTELQQAMIAHAAFRPPYLPGMPGVTPITDPVRVSTMEHPSPGAIAGTVLRQPTPKYPHELAMATHFCNPETVCEAAARILFMSVKWAKNVPAFVNLPFRDQVTLLEEGWRELFVLGAAQFQMPIDAVPLLAAAGISGDQSPTEKAVSIMAEIRALQDIIAKFKAMQIDPTEYACLKGIVIFKTVLQESKEMKSLQDLPAVACLQDQAQLTLSKYIQTSYPTQPFRFGKLLLMLPALKTVGGATIEEVFFRKTIGAIPIERLLVDMYKSNDF